MRDFLCNVLGHQTSGDPVPVYTNITESGEIVSNSNRVGYYMRECKRCHRRIATSPENAAAQAVVMGAISTVMNAERAKYNLPPRSWDD